MGPGRKPMHSQEEFVVAAIALADREGLSAVSTRAVARAVGASATSMYGYFPGRDDLLVAMREKLLGAVYNQLPSDLKPRQALMETALGFRAQALAHPCLSQVMTRSAVKGPVTSSVTTRTLQALRSLGIEGPMLARAYRQLETFVVGATMFDFANQPNHLDDRLQRISLAGDPDLALLLQSTAAIESDNEAAFAASLNCILDAIISQATPHGERSGN